MRDNIRISQSCCYLSEKLPIHRATFHTSPSSFALDKDLRGKKNAIRIAQSSKLESIEGENANDEEDLSGLTE